MISRNIKTVIDLSIGDGSLRQRKTDKYPIIDFTHTIRQREYAESKANRLRFAGLSVVSKQYSGTGKNIGKEYYRVYSHQNPIIHTAYKYLYNKGRKSIDKHLLRILDAESFAFYFLDDGGVTTTNYSLNKNYKLIYENRFATRYAIAAMSFTYEENLLFVTWMYEILGITAKVYQEKNNHCRIYIHQQESMNKLRDIVLPYTTNDMLYKFSYQHGSKGIQYIQIQRNNNGERLNDTALTEVNEAIVQ